MDYLDLYDITPEEEAAQDARELERLTDEWLAAWSEDFWSDEWASVANPVIVSREVTVPA